MKIKTLFALGVIVVGGAALAVNDGENLRGAIAGDTASSAMSDGQTVELTATEAATALTGSWQSKEDSTFRREFMTDGTLVDTYGTENAHVSMGTWIVFTADMPPSEGVTFAMDAGTAYVTIVTGGVPDQYRIAAASASDLQLVHMGTAGKLSFTKIQ